MLSFKFLLYDDVAFFENPNFETKSRRPNFLIYFLDAFYSF